jgi:hypothetical protein
MAFKDLLSGKNAFEKADLKSDFLIANAPVPSFTVGDMDIETVSIEKVDKGVMVLAKAFHKGKPVGFGKDGSIETERFFFINPPTMVDDGTEIFVEEARPSGIIDIVPKRGFKEDPEAALKLIIAQAITEVGKEGDKITPGKIGSTTSTIFSTRDGNLTRNNASAPSQTFTNLRTGNGTGEDDTSAQTGACDLLAAGTSNQYQIMQRYVFIFDTSVVSTDTVNSATLSVYGRGTVVIDGFSGTGQVGMTEGTVADTGAWAITDFQSNTSFTTRWATDVDLGSLTSEAYNAWTFNATGRGAINGSGNTLVGMKINFDIDNSAPTWGAGQETFFRLYSYAEAGTTKDPKIVIDHTAGGGGGATRDARALTLLGVG